MLKRLFCPSAKSKESAAFTERAVVQTRRSVASSCENVNWSLPPANDNNIAEVIRLSDYAISNGKNARQNRSRAISCTNINWIDLPPANDTQEVIEHSRRESEIRLSMPAAQTIDYEAYTRNIPKAPRVPSNLSTPPHVPYNPPFIPTPLEQPCSQNNRFPHAVSVPRGMSDKPLDKSVDVYMERLRAFEEQNRSGHQPNAA